MKIFQKYLVFLLISILIYIIAPVEYYRNYNLLCIIFFVFIAYNFNKDISGNNYFNFHVLFSISFAFTNFVYAAFYHNTDVVLLVFSNRYFNEDVINRSSGLSLLSYSLYALGASIIYKKNVTKFRTNITSNSIVNLLVIISSVIFLLSIDPRFLFGVNIGMGSWNSIAIYSYIIFTNSSLIYFGYFILRIINKEKKLLTKLDYFTIMLIVFVFLIVLRAGERGMPLQVIIIIGFIYSLYKKVFSLKELTFWALIGFSAFTIISYTRVNDVTVRSQEYTFGEMIIGIDLMISNRNLYLAYDYILNNDLTYGRTMLSQIFRFIPVFPSYFFETNNLKPYETDSVHFFNYLTYGLFKSDEKAGVGSSLIGDLLLSFGVLGTGLFMFCFGYVIQLLKNGYDTYKLKNIVIYIVILSLSVYIPRAGYFYVLQPIIWIYLLYRITRLFIRPQLK